MKSLRKTTLAVTLCTVFALLFTLPCFAEVRRIPAAAIVEQGLTAVTLDVEGADNFRYAGQKDKMHTYLGKIKPGSQLKFVIRATLQHEKELPITGRTCLVRMQVIAKKGDTVLKTQSFRKENMSNLYLNYTVPEGADRLEVIERFALTNQSKQEKFNQTVTTINKLVLSTTDDGAAAVAGSEAKGGGPEKNAISNPAEKKDGNDGKDDKKKDISPEEEQAERVMRLTRIISGTAFLILLAAVGGHFFLKNRKSNQMAAETSARKERLRQQAIERQKTLQPQQRLIPLPEEEPLKENTLQDETAETKNTLQQEQAAENQNAPEKMSNAENTATVAGAAQARFRSFAKTAGANLNQAVSSVKTAERSCIQNKLDITLDGSS